MTDRALPTNIDSERFVLGSILLDDSFFPGVTAAIEWDDFSLEKHRRIFRRMGELSRRGERIDRVTVANELMRHSELESCDGLSYLVSLDDGLPRIPNLDSYVRIVKEKATLRRIVLAADGLQNRACMADAESAELLKGFNATLADIGNAQPDDGLQNPHEIIAEEIERAGVEAFFSGGVKGIATPLQPLNDVIVGLQKGDLVLIGARPSVGKTALAMQMARCAADAGEGCIFFSMEMGKLPLSTRLACSAANVDSQLLRTGMISREEQGLLMAAIADMQELPLWIDKSARTVEAMRSKIRRARTKYHVGLVVVDYIQLMATDQRAQNQNQAVAEISRGLKLTAEEFEVPVVALSQLSRPPKGSNPEPALQDLRDSGSLEQDADVVIFIHSPDGKLGTGRRRMIVAKQRNGPVDSMDVTFVGKFQRFEEMAAEPEE